LHKFGELPQNVLRDGFSDKTIPENFMRRFLARFVLMPMPAEMVKGIAEPVVTYAVREGPSAAAPSAEEAGDK
jgi:hypothetical protein